MEPMALGSPTASPTTPTTPCANPNFLPAFLMGEVQQSTPVQQTANVSPNRLQHSSSYKIAQNITEPRTTRQKLFAPMSNENRSTPTNSISCTTTKSGPPKQSLFDTLDQKKSVTPVTNNSIIESPAYVNDSFAKITPESFNQSTSMQHNETWDQSLSAITRDTLWVTIFGFPPSAMSIVLAQFTACGNIRDKKIPTQGNWMHLKYSNVNEVSKALSLNGKMITNSIMIGVVPYYKSPENKENLSLYNSPVGARSLRHSFVSPQTVTISTGQNVPQKSTGLVTKAMEYVFGW